MICEHCYAEPVMGQSGEGWDCVVDVACKDATSEFGDDAGSGPGIGQEEYVPLFEEENNTAEESGFFEKIGGVISSIGNFFSKLFSND